MASERLAYIVCRFECSDATRPTYQVSEVIPSGQHPRPRPNLKTKDYTSIHLIPDAQRAPNESYDVIIEHDKGILSVLNEFYTRDRNTAQRKMTEFKDDLLESADVECRNYDVVIHRAGVNIGPLERMRVHTRKLNGSDTWDWFAILEVKFPGSWGA